MIYEVYLNDNLLYYPNDETYSIFNSKLETALNEAGSFECDIPEHNLRYHDFDDGAQLRSGIITVLKDGEEIFCGEVRECTQNFDFTKHIYAVGELAYLFDSIQPQAVYQGTVTAMFTSLLANHNSQVENRKKFRKGNVLVTDANNYIYHFANREDTLTDIREKLCNTLEGYLKIRKVNGVKYLDLIPLSNYGRYCQQEIQFGENMLDYSQNYTANDVATCVIPLGKRLEEDERTSAAVAGLDEYLTIVGTSVDSYHANKNHDYVYIQAAVNRYGWVRVVKNWDDVTVKENLKTKAEQWLTDAQWARMELELNAVDLSLIDQDIESFEVGDTIHAWAEPYGMDTTFPVRKKVIYLNDLSKNFITLSNTEISKSYTKQTSNAVNEIKEEIPQLSPLLIESRQRALQMLLSETQGGYVCYEYHYDDDGNADYIIAINICNAPTIAASTSRWRWSYNGLGFMTRANINSNWSSATIAITNDGKINANSILTGTLDASTVTVTNLNATNIKSGTLKAQNSKYELNMSTGKVKMQDGEFLGKVQATSGDIGSNATASKRWQIGDHDIHNGVTSMSDDTHDGIYIGTDGVRFNDKPTSASPLAWVKITKGGIDAATIIKAGGYTCIGQGGYQGGYVSVTGACSAQKYNVDGYQGASGQISWATSQGGFSINVKNGIVIGIAST